MLLKCIDHIVDVKPETVFCIERAHPFDKDLSQFRIDMPVSEFIRFGQRVARNDIADTAVIELMGNSQCIQTNCKVNQFKSRTRKDVSKSFYFK